MTRERIIDETVRRVIPSARLGSAAIQFGAPFYGYTAVFSWAPAISAEFRRLMSNAR